MTIINTKTSNWEIIYKADKLRDLTISQQEQAKMFFEMIGDALFVYNILLNETVRSTLEFNYSLVLAEFTQGIQNAVMNSMQQQLWMTPLKGDLAYDTLFGVNLLDEIKNLAIREQGSEDPLAEEIFSKDSSENGSILLQQLFGALDDFIEEINEDSSFEDDEADDDGKEDDEDHDFTEH